MKSKKIKGNQRKSLILAGWLVGAGWLLARWLAGWHMLACAGLDQALDLLSGGPDEAPDHPDCSK